MRYISENEAENFLEGEGFIVIKRFFAKSKFGILKAIQKVGLPFVMKVAGKNLIHKNKLGGIRLNVKTYSEAEHEFLELKKIKGSNGVMFQEKITGKEFLIGIKKTPEFGHVLVFGAGGVKVEEKKDVSFRVCPIMRADAREMIKEVAVSKGLFKEDGIEIENILLRVSNLVDKYEKISELDINPLIVKGGRGVVVDARMVFE